jgi:Icc protein
MDRMQLEDSDVFLKMLTRYKRVKLVLSGHAHQPLNALISGITILGTPSTCYQFKPNSNNFAITNKPACYRWVSLSPNGDIASKIGTLRLTD